LNKSNMVYIHAWLVFLGAVSCTLSSYALYSSNLKLAVIAVGVFIFAVYSTILMLFTRAVTMKESKVNVLKEIVRKIDSKGEGK